MARYPLCRPKVSGSNAGRFCAILGAGTDTFEGSTRICDQAEDAFTNRSFGRPPSIVASEGVYAGGIAGVDERGIWRTDGRCSGGEESDASDLKDTLPLIIGGVVGGMAGLLTLAALVAWLRKARRRYARKKAQSSLAQAPPPSAVLPL